MYKKDLEEEIKEKHKNKFYMDLSAINKRTKNEVDKAPPLDTAQGGTSFLTIFHLINKL